MLVKAYIISNNSIKRKSLRYKMIEVFKENFFQYKIISDQEEVKVNSNNLINRLRLFYYYFSRFSFDLEHKNDGNMIKKFFLKIFYLIKLVLKCYFNKNEKIKLNLKKILIDNEISKKHIKAWRDFINNKAEYIFVCEDDILCNEFSSKRLKKLLFELKKNNIDLEYIDLAGGYTLEKVIPKNRIIENNKSFLKTKGIYTNTACGYLVSKRIILNWINQIDKKRSNQKFPIDFLINYLGTKMKINSYSLHFKDSIFVHGSFNGEVDSWQNIFNANPNYEN